MEGVRGECWKHRRVSKQTTYPSWVPAASYEEVIKRVMIALKGEGFGVLTGDRRPGFVIAL